MKILGVTSWLYAELGPMLSTVSNPDLFSLCKNLFSRHYYSLIFFRRLNHEQTIELDLRVFPKIAFLSVGANICR